MLLSGQVPLTLAREIPGCRLADISLWALYPGGRSILDALSEALGLNEDALRDLREVLRCFGNMSSATIMFVLKSMLRTKSASGSDARWPLVRDLARKA